jgi:hypothetical protein
MRDSIHGGNRYGITRSLSRELRRGRRKQELLQPVAEPRCGARSMTEEVQVDEQDERRNRLFITGTGRRSVCRGAGGQLSTQTGKQLRETGLLPVAGLICKRTEAQTKPGLN